MDRLINIGFSNMIPVEKILMILRPDSSPIKRCIADAKKENMLIDATHGRRTRSVIMLESRHLVLSSVQPETISSRSSQKNDSE